MIAPRLGPELSLSEPSRRGPVEWLYAVVEVAPFSTHDRTTALVVELGSGSTRHTPAGLRAYADRVEHLMTGGEAR